MHYVAVPAESTTASVSPAGDPSTILPVQTESRSGFNDSAVPLAPMVPLAPLPEQQTAVPSVSLAPMPAEEVSTVSPVQQSVPIQNPNQTVASSPSVPLAPLPTVEPSSEAQKGSAHSFAIFNISVYTIISILIASMF